MTGRKFADQPDGRRVLATVLGNEKVDQVQGLSATAGRFADGDLLSILGPIVNNKPAGEVVRADETHSVRNGSIDRQALGQPPYLSGELTAD
ncbi:hypothetical protein ABZ379_28435 [Streptomyces canus]|uniref:hypothetical protein n=1 Tax=Streptomyces canus TaxID=58343 RepID=UPI0033FEAE05